MKQPMQPIVIDEHAASAHGVDLNHLACKGFDRDNEAHEIAIHALGVDGLSLAQMVTLAAEIGIARGMRRVREEAAKTAAGGK